MHVKKSLKAMVTSAAVVVTSILAAPAALAAPVTGVSLQCLSVPNTYDWFAYGSGYTRNTSVYIRYQTSVAYSSGGGASGGSANFAPYPGTPVDNNGYMDGPTHSGSVADRVIVTVKVWVYQTPSGSGLIGTAQKSCST